MHSSSKYTTMIHAQLFQCPFNNSKSISCRWHYQCYLYKTHLYNWEKKFTLLVSSRIFQTCTWKALGTKVILSKGGRSNVFNLTLMNKLMRIEWVSEWVIECHSSAPKSPWHDYVIHELKTRWLYDISRKKNKQTNKQKTTENKKEKTLEFL